MKRTKVSQEIRKTKQSNEFSSLFPYDKGECVCVQTKVMELAKMEMQRMSKHQRDEFIAKHNGKWNCPHSKSEGMKEYEVFCSNCNDKVGEVHATDKYMTDWCNFHYFNFHNAEDWHGCLTANSIGGILKIQCACGADTRDFSNSKKYKNYLQIEEKNKVGREWGKSDSKFKLKLKGQ